MATVSLDRVDVRFPDGTAGLSDISLDVRDGEFVALVGASGSGKTTLLRTVAGFLRPSGGAIAIDGTPVAGGGAFVEPEHRGLGMVFQQHAVWPHWSVGRNVEYPLRMRGEARARRRELATAALERVGLGGFERRDPATLSGGQRQRVAIARALVGEPRVLLLDEALSALDEPLRDRLRLELHALTRELGLTVIHVTHDRDEALALADRVVMLDGGRIVQAGAPEELVERPATADVARFLSDAALIEGCADDAGFAATNHPLRLPAPSVSGARGTVTLAVLPEAISIEPGDDAVVTASLYGRDGSDVVLDWAGVAVRCRSRAHRPKVGDRMRVSVARAIAYPLAIDEQEAA
ncbi:ABC transporter ATP-binding protein [Agrococcus baldri]|uniref:ABC-type quaternary amine transporter n=1 Tax=Agrococcus baldri TaxID=153730 RepID=A0AA87RGL9_9MICO|nr:ABC transporter ATP-binding protein [Agrococcus baldri]GEK80289.1 ABC transporter ATPase [Agrococcus baldri]